MKKILMIVLILLVFAAAGVTVFALTFDADRYRPMIISKIQDQTGMGVELGRISLGWENGAALLINELTLYQDKQKQREFLKLDSLGIVVHLMPLLNRQLEIGSIVIKRPEIQLVRAPDGTLKGFAGLEKKSGGSANTGSAFAGAAFLSTISQVEIQDGRFRFRDESGAYIMDTSVEQIDLTIQGISLNGTVPFKGRAAFASAKQNLQIAGKFKIQPFELEHADFETDLGQIEMESLLKSFPALRGNAPEKLLGRLSASVDGVQPGSDSIFKKGEIRLSDGKIHLSSYPEIKNLELVAGLSGNQVELRKISGNIGEGDFSVTGKVDSVQSRQLAAIQVTAQNLDLGQILPPPGQGEPAFRGKVGLSFEGTSQGLSADALSKTSAGQGQLTLENGVIENLNILREIFGKLSMIPGLVPRLEKNLPPSYQDKLQARDTYIQPAQFPFSIQQGVLLFSNLNLASDSFALSASTGSVSPQFVRAQTVLLVDAELSAALNRSVQEFSSLTDQEGRLSLPINIQGPMDHISVFPDVQYVASKLAMSKLSDFLAPKRTAQNGSVDPASGSLPPGQTPTGTAPSGLDSLRKMKGSDLLAQFLGGAQQGEGSSNQNSSSQQ